VTLLQRIEVDLAGVPYVYCTWYCNGNCRSGSRDFSSHLVVRNETCPNCGKSCPKNATLMKLDHLFYAYGDPDWRYKNFGDDAATELFQAIVTEFLHRHLSITQVERESCYRALILLAAKDTAIRNMLTTINDSGALACIALEVAVSRAWQHTYNPSAQREMMEYVELAMALYRGNNSAGSLDHMVKLGKLLTEMGNQIEGCSQARADELLADLGVQQS